MAENTRCVHTDRLLRWVEFFSLFDFDQGYIPGAKNVLPDHFSRPTSSVVETSDQGTEDSLDLLSLPLLLQEHQHILPLLEASDDAVFPDSEVHSLFYDAIVTAQQRDPEISAIVQ